MTTSLKPAPRFSVKGINDDQSSCECCGRTGLKRVVWIEDLETGKLSHFGVVCATAPAKAFGITTEIRKAVREHDKALAEAAHADRMAVFARDSAEKCERRKALYEERGGSYREFTFPNGRKSMITADTPLWEAAHVEVFGKPKTVRNPLH